MSKSRRSSRLRGNEATDVVTEVTENRKENVTPKRSRLKRTDVILEDDNSPVKRSKHNELDNITVSESCGLPEREHETDDLTKYIKDILAENGSGSIYISGPPGTGKTATLIRLISDKSLATKLKMVYVNCTSISTAGSIYKKICDELDLPVKATTEKQYLTCIEGYFKRKHKTVLLVLDEIDQLTSSKQTVLYNIFEWPSKQNSRLILIGIANALDLTDRLLSRLQARCEMKPHLIQFLPYTKPQLVNILKASLAQNETAEMFNDAALQLLAAKVASTSGDARRALFLARSLVESVEKDSRSKNVKGKSNEKIQNDASPAKAVQIRQVVSTLNKVYGTTQNMNDEEEFPLQQKLLVCALLLILKSGKSKDITVGKLHQVYKTVCSKRNLLSVDQAEFLNLCSLVETRGILRVQMKKEPRLARILLQWDEEEVHNTLNDKQLIASVLSDTSVGKV